LLYTLGGGGAAWGRQLPRCISNYEKYPRAWGGGRPNNLTNKEANVRAGFGHRTAVNEPLVEVVLDKEGDRRETIKTNFQSLRQKAGRGIKVKRKLVVKSRAEKARKTEQCGPAHRKRMSPLGDEDRTRRASSTCSFVKGARQEERASGSGGGRC